MCPSDPPRPATEGAAGFGETDRQLSLAAAYGELQNLLLDAPPVTDFLHRVAKLAAAVHSGASCGITLRRDHEVATVASSDALANGLDEIQYGHGQGPCLHALHTGEEVLVEDATTEQRWPDYHIVAVMHGVCSSLSLPLTVNGIALGALNLYARTRHAFNQNTIGLARDFARQASTVLTLVLRQAERITLEDQMREALATRAVIDQALGILMGRSRITAIEAFAVLRETSQEQNRKLSQIAADLIEAYTGRPPTPPRPFIDRRGLAT